MFSLKFRINIYYIKYSSDDGDYFYSKKISDILNLDIEYYENKLMEFGGQKYNEIMYFLEEEHGLKALEWVESAYIIILLGGN